MPELPEVRTVVKYLNENALNKKITNVDLIYPKLLKNANASQLRNKLTGQSINEVRAFGKFILIKTKDYDLVSHLRMEGKWVVENTNDYQFSKSWLELSIKLNKDQSLNYYDSRKFGTLEIYESGQGTVNSSINSLGPEPFDVNESNIEDLFSKLGKSTMAIKTKLLDQHFLAGLGNIYVNEILWSAKVLPTRPSNKIKFKEFELIIEESKKVLNASIKLGGTTIHSFAFGDNREGQFQEMLQVHGKTKQKCPVCGKLIMKSFVNGRGTYYCENCQA